MIVADREAFATHYASISLGSVIGEFANETNLKNGGERLTLLDRKDSTLWSIRYDNVEPWPKLAEGHSLVYQGGDTSSVESWAGSAKQGGTPGAPEEASEAINHLPGLTDVRMQSNSAFGFTLPEGVTGGVEYSTDLRAWKVIATGVTGPFEETNADRLAAPEGYYRAKQ